MKRKLSGSVKRIIGLFGGIVVCIGAVFGFGIFNSIQNVEDNIPVSADCVVYDANGNKIVLDSPATIYKSHLGDYRLIDSNKNSYSLGDNTVIYDEGSLKILGGGYQVISDTEVSKIEDYSVIDDFNYSGFFKLADRRYLMIGNSIGGEGYPVSTDGYLFVVMDKSGNAMLLNDEVCEKTTSASAVSVDGEYIFDIANESLAIGDKIVNCASIIGSTNEYKEEDDPTAIRDKINALKAEGRDTSNPDEIIIDAKGGTGGQGGNGGAGGPGGYGGPGGAGGPGGEGGLGVAPEATQARRNLNLYNIVPSYTSAAVEYYVSDPYGLLGEVKVKVSNLNPPIDPTTGSNLDPVREISCDLDASKVTIFNLLPSARYKLELIATSDASKTSTQYFNTLDPEASISVLSMTDTEVKCNVKYAYGLGCNTATVCLAYSDDMANPLATAAVELIKASSTDGHEITFTLPSTMASDPNKRFSGKDSNKYLVIYFKEATYNGVSVNINSKQFFTNTLAGKQLWDEWVVAHESCFALTYTEGYGGVASTNAKDEDYSIVSSAITDYENRRINATTGYSTGFEEWDAKSTYATLIKIRELKRSQGVANW